MEDSTPSFEFCWVESCPQQMELSLFPATLAVSFVWGGRLVLTSPAKKEGEWRVKSRSFLQNPRDFDRTRHNVSPPRLPPNKISH